VVQVVDRLVVDLSPDGMVSVATHLEGDDLADSWPSFQLAWPLDEETLGSLRWYLEDYLPSAVYDGRGQQVQGLLSDWGAELFWAVFGDGPARDAYQRVRGRRSGTQIVFRSSSPGLLALPWELMRDPDRPRPLALDLAGMSRSLPAGQLAATVPVGGGKLRVLMVIARPEGERDVGYQMIARPLLERLRAVRGRVDLVVLRPPTLDALVSTLAQASAEGSPFQIVHFDGHGTQTGEGLLDFEKPGGGSDLVPATAIAQVLSDAGVPVVVLNACQSGAIGKNLEAAVATRLLAEGIGSVVAMAYKVYAVAAAEFMAAFYERLFAGDPVSTAVTAGRKRMALRNGRPSRKGDLPLDDWMIPVHYVRRDVSFPQLLTERTEAISLDESLDRISAAGRHSGARELDPVGSFIGRDWLTCQLETAARLQRVVILHGPGGTGKTELAKAFGRWWQDTGGVDRPDYVFFHSFEPGVATFGLDGVVNQIGRRLFDTEEFDRKESADRRATVENELAARRMLLIWDNFETVRSMPDPAGVTKPLDEDACQNLRVFLTQLAGRGRSTVLITSRSPEVWLGDLRRIAVGGLTPPEADQYASYLLEPYPAAAGRRRKPVFGELLDWLDGHPLSMRLILPRLEATEPRVLLDALRGTIALPGTADIDGDRLTSLPASIAYSFTHLSPPARRLLPAISLFQRIASTDLLRRFSAVDDVPERFLGVTEQEWIEALDEAADVGLLTRVVATWYLIHPALPGYLATQWRAEEAAGYDASRAAAIRALIAACAAFSDWIEEAAEGGAAYKAADLLHRTLGSMLSYALAEQLWDDVRAIHWLLRSYWDREGLTEEADHWADEIRLAVEDAPRALEDLESPASHLWVLTTYMQANRQREDGQLDQAQHSDEILCARLEAYPPTPLRQSYLAAVYNQLGTISHQEGLLDDAEQWYRKAQSIDEETDQTSASVYNNLGIIAAEQGRFDDAEELHRKALAIDEEDGDEKARARTLRHLGVAALERGRFDDAEDWYRKALAIEEELGDKSSIAITCHLLGVVAGYQDEFDDAENWYRESLALKEELGDARGIAATYHQLGNLAWVRERLDDAEDWYRKALNLEADRSQKSDRAATYGQLGRVAESRGDIPQALEWTIRCVALFDEFPHPMTGPGPRHLARYARHLGIGALEETWRRVTGSPLPQAVQDYVEEVDTDDG
jgi:tetratricopeptide (TPR) repeat protein